MIDALRAALREALQECDTVRPPALRRAKEDEWLFASDLPMLLTEKDLSLFQEQIGLFGWKTWCAADGWIRFDHEIPLPEMPCPVASAVQEELASLISLLERHPSNQTDQILLRRICKAGDEGPSRLKNTLADIHKEWAACLRQHKALPAGLLPYLRAMQVDAHHSSI